MKSCQNCCHTQIFYPEEADGGTWWNGSIIKDSLQDQGNALDDAQDKADDERAEEDEFLEGIWERFTVSWDEQVNFSEA